MKKKMSVYLPLVCLALSMASATASTPVLDRNGDEVLAGVAYMIYHIVSPGRLSMTPSILPRNENNPCPLDVYLTPIDLGLPLTFHPEEGDLVTLSADVNIKFNVTTACEESTVWQVVRDDSVDRGIVSTGGVLGNQLSASWFRIERAESGFGSYQLKYCARNSTTSVCSNIGSVVSPRLHVLNEDERPLSFIITKTHEPRLSSVV